MLSRKHILILCLLLDAAAAAPAAGQGHRGSPPGRGGGSGPPEKKPGVSSQPTTSNSSPSAPSEIVQGPSSTGTGYFGSWLDDASVMAPGTAWFGLSMGYWRAAVDHQLDAPVMSAAAGLGPRVQMGLTVPVYHFSDQWGASANGVGTVHLYGKIGLWDPNVPGHPFGLAVTPLIEITTGSRTDRTGWALPVSAEVRRGGYRFYGSSGYFSRGAFFMGGAAEAPVGQRASITGTFTRSYSTRSDAASDVQGHLTDIGAGGYLTLTPSTGIFGTIGHSFATDAGGTWFGAGVSIRREQ
jgi:hypothetical protein